MPEAGEDIETTMLPLKGASPFNRALSGRFRHFRGQVYRLPKRNYSGCHCEGVFCPKQSRVEQEKPCFGRLLHSQKALVRSDTPVSSGWLNSYAKTKNLPYRQMISAPKGGIFFRAIQAIQDRTLKTLSPSH
jgi:hypothetical protein